MDAAKIIDLVQAAGPGAGLGLALGLLFFIMGLPAKKWVMWGRFQDMIDQRDKCDREKLTAERDRDAMRAERDEVKLLMALTLSTARKNAHLASSVMIKRVKAEGGPDDGPGQARLSAGQ